ncbi:MULTISPECIES: hypothetical protein [Actinosynnema]|uniref:hypothetical protein n=1 Tax=Actinosynnema TaxID=40566 RepID=UPI0020A52873|nr:hypothetical protein [Actinosynnema pretiosum]MCP2097326.1 hypothetical protein [Actinosynnema pretiosum]
MEWHEYVPEDTGRRLAGHLIEAVKELERAATVLREAAEQAPLASMPEWLRRAGVPASRALRAVTAHQWPHHRSMHFQHDDHAESAAVFNALDHVADVVVSV